jgi:outer membrane protein OmpA-like peptidoglycan-associated protein
LATNLKHTQGFQSLVIEGHTDAVGSEELNQWLSQKRADQVKQMMISFGIPSEKITTVGLGYTRPIATNSSEQGRALNRRIEFKVLYQNAKVATAH